MCKRLAAAVALVAFALSAGVASAHHEPKHVKVTILGFSAKKRVGERLPSDAVQPGRTYRHCKSSRLYAFVNFKNMRENQPFEVVWTLNDRRLSKKTLRWPAGTNEFYDQFVASAGVLRPGVYQLFVRTSGKLRDSGRVTVPC